MRVMGSNLPEPYCWPRADLRFVTCYKNDRSGRLFSLSRWSLKLSARRPRPRGEAMRQDLALDPAQKDQCSPKSDP
jgi:hypothetical protein